MRKHHKYHGFFHKYHNVYLYIGILVGCGILTGIVLSNFIDVNDIKHLSSYLTTVSSGVNKYDFFVSQFFTGILFILFVFLLGTSFAGIPLISFVVFTKGLQIGFSCALFVFSYQLKGIAGIFMTLLPQVLFDLIATFLISASAIQLSMYIVYSCTNREKLDFKKLANSILNDIFICFLIVLIGSYLKSTIGIECIKLFNLM
ncbi:stage II sporulation protein M [Amedibacillus sp. YH-ame10]